MADELETVREERDKLVARLRRAEEELRLISDNVPAGIAYLDANETYGFVNRTLAAWLGRSPATLIGLSVSEVLGSEAYALVRPQLLRALEGTTVSFIEHAPYSTGTRWVEVTYVPHYGAGVRPLGIVMMAIDVSERRAEEHERARLLVELQNRDERQAVLIAAGSGLARAMLDTGRMARDVVELLVQRIATSARVELFGDDETVAERFEATREGFPSEPPDSSARVVTAPLVARARVLGTLTFSSRQRVYEKADAAMAEELGRQLAVAIDNARLFDAAQTERRHAEEASRAKDEFLAMVSHELRTPLNAMLGWATMLRGGTLGVERQQQALEVIERNVRAQAQLVEELLDISRVITGKLRLDVQVVDLEAIVSDVVEAMRPAAEGKGLTLRISTADELEPISGDPDRLRQVVYNLMSNAVRHTPRGGDVEVKIAREDGEVEISVADNGEGIASDLVPHIFERFRQGEGGTTRRYGGLGLGLAIVKHIVELHGGSIRVFSAGKGTGAKFTVRVPISLALSRNVDSAPIAPRKAIDRGIERRPELAGLRALVVDDDADARELVATVLGYSDVEVVTAPSVADALARFDERVPDVVLSDIGMPGADGYSLVEAIRKRPAENGGRTPAIALTAFARLEDRTRALLAGYNMHVAKPIEPSELLVVLSAVTGRIGQPARS